MDDCLFCKFARKELPTIKVAEDEETFAFLDIHPVNHGHTLVIPKEHSRNILDVKEETMGSIMRTVQKVAKAVHSATKADGINIIMNNEPVAGQAVFHAHIHVIPRFQNDGLKGWEKGRGYEDGEAADLAEAIGKIIE